MKASVIECQWLKSEALMRKTNTHPRWSINH